MLARLILLSSLDPPVQSSFALSLISNYKDKPLDVVLDFRNAAPELRYMSWRSLLKHKHWTWSVAAGDGARSAGLAVDLPFDRLKTLQWENSAFSRRPYHEALLQKALAAPMLEELNVDEGRLTPNAKEYSFAPRICELIKSLPGLKRLHIKGTEVSRHACHVIPQMKGLEALSISSSYRNVFHPGC